MREIDATIEDVAFGGKGVARDQGKAVFIPFTIDGEQVRATIVREKKSFSEGKAEEILMASPQRVVPECPYFGRCGGCSYQHIAYKHQLELKTRQVDQALQRIGRFADATVQAMIPSPEEYTYRNRITVHVEDGTVGYFRRDEHRLIDIEHCPIAQPEVNKALARLRVSRPRDGHYTLRAHSGPRVFSQTNDEVARRLFEHVSALIPSRGNFLVDAYCGAGFFSKQLREKFDRIIGIDWDVHAIRAAQEATGKNESYRAGDVVELLDEVFRDADPVTTTVLVDPPADGLSAAVRHLLIEFMPSNLIYISCNPSTLARDLAGFREYFRLEPVAPFDMFPQTAEIEVVAHLRPTLNST